MSDGMELAGSVTTEGFSLGQLVITIHALHALTEEDIRLALARHVRGDWGDVDEDDKRANELALQYDARILSSYQSSNNTKFWVITEADRSQTTVLLPEDY